MRIRTGKGDEARRALPEDASLAAELAAAAAKAAAKAREGEVRDALYLSVVHKFNACGVPLVVDPGDYGANALPSARPSRHSRHPLGARGVVGALERAVAAAPGAGDASARRRRRRFAEKTRRLQREMLPEGAEALLDEHQSKLVSVALGSADGGGSARSVRARDHDARRVVGMTRMRVGMPRACAERK